MSSINQSTKAVQLKQIDPIKGIKGIQSRVSKKLNTYINGRTQSNFAYTTLVKDDNHNNQLKDTPTTRT